MKDSANRADSDHAQLKPFADNHSDKAQQSSGEAVPQRGEISEEKSHKQYPDRRNHCGLFYSQSVQSYHNDDICDPELYSGNPDIERQYCLNVAENHSESYEQSDSRYSLTHSFPLPRHGVDFRLIGDKLYAQSVGQADNAFARARDSALLYAVQIRTIRVFHTNRIVLDDDGVVRIALIDFDPLILRQGIGAVQLSVELYYYSRARCFASHKNDK